METNETKAPDMHNETAQAEQSACEKELQQVKERYLYLNAEFDNYKKRLEKERGQWAEFAQDDVLLSVLAVVDDMDRALEGFRALPPELAAHAAGLDFIAKGLSKILNQYGLQEIPLVKEFDPERYEAIVQVASESHQSGEIVAILQKGYMRHGRVLRPAKVSVAQ